jgi:outer membrane immunogenic protein
MKHRILAIVLGATLLSGSAALGADLPPAKAVRPIPPPLVPVPTWTGFYFGINGSFGWGRDRVDFNGLGPIFLSEELFVGPRAG